MSSSNGGPEGTTGVANGFAPASRSIEAEQLKAQVSLSSIESCRCGHLDLKKRRILKGSRMFLFRC